MAEHSSNHTRHTGNTLQEDKPNKPLALGHLEPLRHILGALGRMPVSRHEVRSPTQKSYRSESNPVGPVPCLSVSNGDIAHLLLGVSGGSKRQHSTRSQKYGHMAWGNAEGGKEDHSYISVENEGREILTQGGPMLIPSP